MRKVSRAEAELISDLQNRFGSRAFRTILTLRDTGAFFGSERRLMSNRRLGRLISGSGKISEREADQLQLAKTNAPSVQNLLRKNEGKNPTKVFRAIRDWLSFGKESTQSYNAQSKEMKQRQLDYVMPALGFLGIEPSEGTYYVRKRKR